MRCGIAIDAGVLFKIAETEQAANPTRSATVRSLTTACLSDTTPPIPSDSQIPKLLLVAGAALTRDDEVSAQREPFVGKTKLQKFGRIFCDLAEDV